MNEENNVDSVVVDAMLVESPVLEGMANTSNEAKEDSEKGLVTPSLPSKRISCDLIGDDALQADILVTSLQISGSKLVKDGVLVSLAIKALNKVVEDCSKETGKRFPNELEVLAFLDRE